jgi:hypothetical protein
MTKESVHKSFLLYCDQVELIEKLTDEQAGFLIKKIYGYCGNGRQNPNIQDPMLDMVFTSMKIALDRDHKTWLNKAEANRENGKKGGRPEKPKKPTG